MKTNVVILAAGKGTRMYSKLPKVLHQIGGKPLLAHCLASCAALPLAKLVVVYGHQKELVQAAFAEHSNILWAAQDQQLGTGHALQQAYPLIADSGADNCLVLVGDAPLIQAHTLEHLLAVAGKDKLAILTVNAADPTGYGRIIKNADGTVRKITEHQDASAEERQITEINSGIMVIPMGFLATGLAQLTCDNAQQEYYLTDLIALANRAGIQVVSDCIDDINEVAGINNKQQLAALERVWQQRQVQQLLQSGVTVLDPARLDVRGQLRCGADVTLDINCIFTGEVELGDNVHIGAGCVIHNSRIAANTVVKPYCVIDSAEIGEACDIGPYARLRPGTVLAAGAKVGNFVETKNAAIGSHSKVNHLSYIGDAKIGAGVNIGAGTITCNYDGVNKSTTLIEDGAFIGSNTCLVAPVAVGKDATIGAGSVITKDAPASELSIARSRQQSRKWQRPTKKG